jgi:integrase
MVATFLEAVAGEALEAVWTTSFLLGLRRGEVLGLTWSDIDWDENTLTVSGQLDRYTGNRRPRKGHADPVVHPMPQRVRDVLRSRLTIQKREQMLAGSSWSGNALDLVVTTWKGTPLPATTLDRMWRAIIQRLGLPYMKFHGARHLAATIQYSLGARHEEVAHFLGHADNSTVTRLYVHLTDAVGRDAADRVNRLFPAKRAQPEG